MRFPILILAIASAVCRAQPPEDAVLSVYRQMERAEQTGDAETWFRLWSARSDTAAHPEMKSMVHARPSVHYGVSKVIVDGDRAALAGSMNEAFVSVRFVYETGSWKILDAQWSNTAIDPASLYALIPPGDGAFARAGSPWDRVEAAQGTKKWKLRAVSDESYLYLRIEASAVLPAPNTEVAGTFPNLSTGVPRDWPKMKIRTAKGEFTMDAFDGVGDKATFDAAGKANSHRHFVAYSMMLWRGDHVVVNTSEEPLIAIRDRFIDLRIPLKTLGVEARARIAIADANLPASFVTYQGKPF